jgi:hypothetical protein
MSTFTIVFMFIIPNINSRLLLAKTIENLYYVNSKAIGIKKKKKKKKKSDEINQNLIHNNIINNN